MLSKKFIAKLFEESDNRVQSEFALSESKDKVAFLLRFSDSVHIGAIEGRRFSTFSLKSKRGAVHRFVCWGVINERTENIVLIEMLNNGEFSIEFYSPNGLLIKTNYARLETTGSCRVFSSPNNNCMLVLQQNALYWISDSTGWELKCLGQFAEMEEFIAVNKKTRTIVYIDKKGELRFRHIDSSEEWLLRESLKHAHIKQVAFNEDGTQLYLLTDHRSEFIHLAKIDVLKGNLSWVRKPNQDVELFAVSPDSRYLAWVENIFGWSHLCIQDQDGEIVLVNKTPPCMIRQLVYLGNHTLLLVCDTPAAEDVIYYYDIQTSIFECIQSSKNIIRRPYIVYPQLVKFQGSEVNLTLSSLVYRPRSTRNANGNIVYLHGGPESQERPTYNPVLQALAHEGYTIFCPNFRGSTGFGKTFQTSLYGGWGTIDIEDLESFVHYLEDCEEVDIRNVILMGNSYGGYLALMGASVLKVRWKAVISIAGPLNLNTMIRNMIDGLKSSSVMILGDPESEEDSKWLLERSPVTHAHKLRCPALFIRGESDSMVPQEEVNCVIEKISTNQLFAQSITLDGYGHRLKGIVAKKKLYLHISDFLKRINNECNEG